MRHALAPASCLRFETGAQKFVKLVIVIIQPAETDVRQSIIQCDGGFEAKPKQCAVAARMRDKELGYMADACLDFRMRHAGGGGNQQNGSLRNNFFGANVPGWILGIGISVSGKLLNGEPRNIEGMAKTTDEIALVPFTAFSL